jgi:hypothetical protein
MTIAADPSRETQIRAGKISGDAIVYEDGSQVAPPIATCEEQGFAYAAKLQMSELLWWLDEKEEARRISSSAAIEISAVPLALTPDADIDGTALRVQAQQSSNGVMDAEQPFNLEAVLHVAAGDEVFEHGQLFELRRSMRRERVLAVFCKRLTQLAKLHEP